MHAPDFLARLPARFCCSTILASFPRTQSLETTMKEGLLPVIDECWMAHQRFLLRTSRMHPDIPKCNEKGQPSEHGWQPKKDCHLTATFCQSCKCIPVASVECRFQTTASMMPLIRSLSLRRLQHFLSWRAVFIRHGLSLKRLTIYLFLAAQLSQWDGVVVFYYIHWRCNAS